MTVLTAFPTAMACRRCLLLIAAWTPVQMAFHAGLPSASVVNRGAAVTMASAEVTAEKAKVVEEVKQHMEDSMMMFCVRSETITSNKMNEMRQKFPETTTVRVVKNTLVKRASDASGVRARNRNHKNKNP